MMRVHVLSDLHLENRPWGAEAGEGAPPPSDLVVLAGDSHTKKRTPTWAARQWPTTPVVVVAGNHEYYDRAWTKEIAAMQAAAPPHVHVLERACVDFPAWNLRVAGATLWTDFCLFGEAHREAAMAEAGRLMNDYRYVRLGYGGPRLTPNLTATRHRLTAEWLLAEGERARRDRVRLLVVTHHPPVRECLGPGPYELADAAYASARADLVEAVGADCWITGHTHRRQDFLVGQTRMLSNARGRGDEPASWGRYDPNLVTDVRRSDPRPSVGRG